MSRHWERIARDRLSAQALRMDRATPWHRIAAQAVRAMEGTRHPAVIRGVTPAIMLLAMVEDARDLRDIGSPVSLATLTARGWSLPAATEALPEILRRLNLKET